MSKPIHIESTKQFDEALEGAEEKLVVIDFFATWCGPCRMIAPVIEELAKNNEDVVFLKVDVDELEDLAIRYKVRAMPTFLFLKKGEKVGDLIGANKKKLGDLVAEYK